MGAPESFSDTPLKLKWRDAEAIKGCLKGGGIIALPTETVPGLVGLPAQHGKVNLLKGSPADKPLGRFVACAQEAFALWQDEDEGLRQLAGFWPGPLTIIHRGLGIRIPAVEPLLGILKITGPLLNTSANLSGHPPPQKMEDLHPELLAELAAVIMEPVKDAANVASCILMRESDRGFFRVLRRGEPKMMAEIEKLGVVKT